MLTHQHCNLLWYLFAQTISQWKPPIIKLFTLCLIFKDFCQMEQLGQVHFARKTLVPTLILRNSPKLSHQCFVAALQLATGVRLPHGSRLLFRQDLRLGGMLTRPRSAPGRDTISCPFICLCMCLCLCVSYIEFTWAVDADVVAVDKANWLSANSPSRRRHSAWLCRSCSEVCGRKVVR